MVSNVSLRICALCRLYQPFNHDESNGQCIFPSAGTVSWHEGCYDFCLSNNLNKMKIILKSIEKNITRQRKSLIDLKINIRNIEKKLKDNNYFLIKRADLPTIE